MTKPMVGRKSAAPAALMPQDAAERLMKDWEALNMYLRDATESECLSLLHFSRKVGARKPVVSRIFSRFNALRGRRERMEALS
ncbi:hypothetical protein KGP36_02405 [Patescibacteria group bacterium]|nr:hypothetical protein [Patescibacteria group bacterium]